MGQKAYLLIETAVGKTGEVAKFLEGQTWLDSVERMTGPYDIVAVAHAPEGCKIDDLANDGIKGLDGIAWMAVCPISIDQT